MKGVLDTLSIQDPASSEKIPLKPYLGISYANEAPQIIRTASMCLSLQALPMLHQVQA